LLRRSCLNLTVKKYENWSTIAEDIVKRDTMYTAFCLVIMLIHMYVLITIILFVIKL